IIMSEATNLFTAAHLPDPGSLVFACRGYEGLPKRHPCGAECYGPHLTPVGQAEEFATAARLPYFGSMIPACGGKVVSIRTEDDLVHDQPVGQISNLATSGQLPQTGIRIVASCSEVAPIGAECYCIHRIFVR